MKKIKDVRDKISDEDVKKAYDKYRNYLLELQIYEACGEGNDKINLFKLAGLYKKSGLEVSSKKELEERFENFSTKIEAIKQENKDADLRDIRTQEGRRIVSDAIYETQNDKKFKPADLDAVAVIENFALCVALGQVQEGMKDKESVLKDYEISEEEFEQAQASYEKYEKTGMIDIYNGMFERNQGETPNKIVHYTAGVLEMRPSEARKDLSTIQILKGNRTKESNKEKSLVVYSISQIIIDNIMRDPELSPEEKNKKICELELIEYQRVLRNVEEANRKQNTDRYKIVKEEEQREIG